MTGESTARDDLFRAAQTKTVRSQVLRIKQTKAGAWRVEYFGISTYGTTRTKALARMSTVLNKIDAFAAAADKRIAARATAEDAS